MDYEAMKPTFFRNRRILAALAASWWLATAYSCDVTAWAADSGPGALRFEVESCHEQLQKPWNET
jgi:hypothetical protein